MTSSLLFSPNSFPRIIQLHVTDEPPIYISDAAVGVQRSEQKIIITFATNQAQEPDHIHQQLETIWDLLKQVSDMYHDHQVATISPKSSPIAAISSIITRCDC